MTIHWRENLTKADAFNSVKEYCLQYDITQENASFITLLLPFGNFSNQQEVQELATKFKEHFPNPAVIAIEPVLIYEDKDLKLLYKTQPGKNELLPFFHIHILAHDNGSNLNYLRQFWENIIRNKRKYLFKCSYLEKSISDAANYLTKFFENKRGKNGNIGFHFCPLSSEKSIDEVNLVVKTTEIFKKTVRKIKKLLNNKNKLIFIKKLIRRLKCHHIRLRAP